MNKIKKKLRQLAKSHGDINQHLYTLMGFAEGCDHITEMGVSEVVSTWALLAANPKKLISIDIKECPVEEASAAAVEAGIDFQFIVQDTIDPWFSIEETDFLLIDTLHTYTQLKEELLKHGNKSRKYIAFHDTTTFGTVNDGGIVTVRKQGLQPAIIEFLKTNPHWKIANIYEHNNGLTILERI
jgi:predicted O-methyltransferase YrrM